MRRLLFITAFLLSACTDSLDYKESTPKKRPVYFLTATLEKNGREVRIMIDSLDTRMMELLITRELGSELDLYRGFLENPEQQLPWYPFYDVILDWTCSEFRFNFGGKEYGFPSKEVVSFSRQERLTGEHIDIVIGRGYTRIFNNDLSALPIDKRMTVPYDWGTSEE